MPIWSAAQRSTTLAPARPRRAARGAGGAHVKRQELTESPTRSDEIGCLASIRLHIRARQSEKARSGVQIVAVERALCCAAPGIRAACLPPAPAQPVLERWRVGRVVER